MFFPDSPQEVPSPTTSIHNDVFFRTLHDLLFMCLKIAFLDQWEDGGKIGGSGVHFPSTPVKHLADLRSRVNSQQYSSIYEDQIPKTEDIERCDSKKSA